MGGTVPDRDVRGPSVLSARTVAPMGQPERFEHGETVCYVIPVIPVGKGRPRMGLRNGKVMTYTPRATVQAEDEIKTILGMLRPVFHDDPKVPLNVGITFRVTPPEKRVRLHPTTTPDIDNLIKTVLDACNGILWKDDALITQLVSFKEYASRKGGEEIRVTVGPVPGWERG